MEMVCTQLTNSSYHDSLKALEADIQHANSLAASIPRSKGGALLQMKLVYNSWAPLFFFLLQRIDCSCLCLLPRYLNLFHILVYKVHNDGRPNISTHGRKATIRQFYGVILPSLQRLQSNFAELGGSTCADSVSLTWGQKRVEGDKRLTNVDIEREDECGICLEPGTKMVLPNCCHSMCIKCYRNWNARSESCPFCRGGIKRVKSEDLWVLTCNDDIVDRQTICHEDVLRFYLYINSLPKDYPDALFLVYYEYLM